jgi:hypothetical protein
MHAIVFRITINDQKESDRLLHEEFVPFMSQSPGFVAGYWVTTGENQGTSVIAFESEDAARRVADQAGPPDTKAFTVESFDIGEVVAHA